MAFEMVGPSVLETALCLHHYGCATRPECSQQYLGRGVKVAIRQGAGVMKVGGVDHLEEVAGVQVAGRGQGAEGVGVWQEVGVVGVEAGAEQ